jgi:hypothetical protein
MEMLKSMESARNDISENARRKLDKLWELAKTTDGMLKDRDLIRIGLVSDRLNKAMSEALGMEVKAEIQYIRLKDVRHIDEVHGVGNEKDSAQIPVTKDMFMLMPDVLKNFSKVEKGSITIDRPSVKITKHYSDGRIIIADAVLEDGNLNITSMLAKKPTAIKS